MQARIDCRSVPKKYREVKQVLRAHGWRPVRTGKGSHEIWIDAHGHQVTIAGGGKDNRQVPTGTLANIRRRTGLEELR